MNAINNTSESKVKALAKAMGKTEFKRLLVESFVLREDGSIAFEAKGIAGALGVTLEEVMSVEEMAAIQAQLSSPAMLQSLAPLQKGLTPEEFLKAIRTGVEEDIDQALA